MVIFPQVHIFQRFESLEEMEEEIFCSSTGENQYSCVLVPKIEIYCISHVWYIAVSVQDFRGNR
jgi:hypothetical protein